MSPKIVLWLKPTKTSCHSNVRRRIEKLHEDNNKNLFKSKMTTYNKRLETKIVADWELNVVVSRTEPVHTDCAAHGLDRVENADSGLGKTAP